MEKFRKSIFAIASVFALSASAQYTPAVVMEEATGEWCSWCPRGIVAIESMLKSHPDGTFIPIAVHGNDEFEIDGYLEHMQTNGYPKADFNRNIVDQNPTATIAAYNYNMLRYAQVVGKVDATYMVTNGDSQLDVTTTATFGASSSKKYNIAIVVTENSVKGLYQKNAYAGGGNGAMGGFESKPSTIYGYVFDHVARLIYPEFNGKQIANGVSANSTVKTTFNVPIPLNVKKIGNLEVIALLIEDGKIINACYATREKFKPTFVDGEPYTSKDVQQCDLTYTRKFTSTNWQALYVPFNMSYSEWCDYADVAEINGVHQFDNDNDGVFEETLIEFRVLKSGEIRTNTPYVIRPKSTGTVNFECKDKFVAPAPAENGKIWCATSRLKYTLTGVYESTDITGAYALNKGTFYRATSTSPKLQPYRIYLTIDPVDNGYGVMPYYMPQNIKIKVDDEVVSGIEDLYVAPAMDGAYYDMLGRKVENPTTGIYIHNGRKVILK